MVYNSVPSDNSVMISIDTEIMTESKILSLHIIYV